MKTKMSKNIIRSLNLFQSIRKKDLLTNEALKCHLVTISSTRDTLNKNDDKVNLKIPTRQLNLVNPKFKPSQEGVSFFFLSCSLCFNNSTQSTIT